MRGPGRGVVFAECETGNRRKAFGAFPVSSFDAVFSLVIAEFGVASQKYSAHYLRPAVF